jgi:hypothetical protein
MVPLRKNATPGPRGKRGIHLLDCQSKGFYAQKMRRRADADPQSTRISHMSHGFVRGRRRESAILVQNSTAWRMKKVGRSGIITHYDLANAFGSTVHEELMETVEQCLLLPEDVKFGNQRVQWAHIETPGLGGNFCMRPKCGALMGDPFAVKSFSETFAKPLQQYNSSLLRTQGAEAAHALHCRCPFPQEAEADTPVFARCDLGLTNFADDTTRLVVGGEDESIEQLAARVIDSTDNLDDCIAPCGYGQNRKKMTCLPACSCGDRVQKGPSQTPGC